MQDAAVRVMAEWPDVEAAVDLLELAKNTQNEAHHVLAIRGYIRLATRQSRLPAAIDMFKQALTVARRVDEKKAGAVPVLVSWRTVEAMKLAQA